MTAIRGCTLLCVVSLPYKLFWYSGILDGHEAGQLRQARRPRSARRPDRRRRQVVSWDREDAERGGTQWRAGRTLCGGRVGWDRGEVGRVPGGARQAAEKAVGGQRAAGFDPSG